MAIDAVEVFYAYAREDAELRTRLERHLAALRRQGFISEWHEEMVEAGAVQEAEVNRHLMGARIILLLVSSDFVASDYCYGTQVQEAMQRQKAGEAIVIPIILRPCDWRNTPFGPLQALPRDGRPVTLQPNEDLAFTEIAQQLRQSIERLSGVSVGGAKQNKSTKRIGEGTMGFDEHGTGHTPSVGGGAHTGASNGQGHTTIGANALKSAISHYYQELADYKQGQVESEMGVRSAFQNLLANTARNVNWLLVPEQTIEGGIRPDGVLRDGYKLKRGFWEAKGPHGDLEKEIRQKIADGYPLTNTIFENSKRAVLYQNKRRYSYDFDLGKANDVSDLLKQFLTYTEPDIANFETAVQEFKDRIPEHAQALLDIIEQEHKQNRKFIAAFDTFRELCQKTLDPRISDATIKEMLVQHLLTERLFRTVFDNPDFVSRNVIASEIEKVIQALTSRSFNRNDFLKTLDRFYVAIERAAKDINDWSERQGFLNTVYERFFQGFAVKKADTLGIVYTPQEIVDFMCNSVAEVLESEFGTKIEEPGVQILDPATGTGNFIVNLMEKHISRHRLKQKYREDLFCNEITLLPYYIASLNIEHEYYEKVGEYESFEGICFADTLELADSQQLSLFSEENTERVQREKDAKITVIIGNPPYNVGQKNENDNNKNRRYAIVDYRIKDTYVKESKATLKTQLYDAYVRFFRWATDRLQERDGIICLVTNNSFVDQFAFDGMRQQFFKDFNYIYHVDLHGNVRKNPKLSGTTHNVFGIQVGVGITIAVRNSKISNKTLYYYRVPEFWRRTEKLAFLSEKKSINNIDWLTLQPDERNTWITEGLHTEFAQFLPMGIKKVDTLSSDTPALFRLYSGGVKTNRDNWAYDFNKLSLEGKMQRFVDTYNNDVSRWQRRGNNTTSVDDFVTYDDQRIKWSGDLKVELTRGKYTSFSKEKIRNSLYRPFVKEYLYLDSVLNNSIYLQPKFFPTPASENENVVIVVNDIGYRSSFSTLATNVIPDLHLLASVDAYQCFPFYTYAEDRSNRRENITDWALRQFEEKYGAGGRGVTKWDIFHYVYGLLHHPLYQERYAENLKRDLPHIPLVRSREAYEVCRRIGKALMELHLGYEDAKEYKLEWIENEAVPFSDRVQKMRLSPDKTQLVVNESLTFGGIPQECFGYRLGNRSALEWVIDQYQVSVDKRSGIESDPNMYGDEGYILKLIRQVVTVSVETVRLVGELMDGVRVEDWVKTEG